MWKNILSEVAGEDLVEATALDSTLLFAFVVLGEESKKAICSLHVVELSHPPSVASGPVAVEVQARLNACLKDLT